MEDFQILTEKYRPKKLDQIIGQDIIIKKLKSYVERKNMPNLLFAGSPGNSKTTSSICLARELYGDQWQVNFKELNASDSRGIDVIREDVKDYASVKSIGDIPFKIILLDEAESLTSDAQNALKRTMEKYTKSCRFVLTCNYSSKIIEPIVSRTSVFRFKKIKSEDIIKICKNICTQEKITIESEALEAIAYVSDGDARKAIGMLDTARLTLESNNITLKDVYQLSSFIEPKLIISIIKNALSQKFFLATSQVEDLIMDGLAAEDILKQMMTRVMEMSLPTERLNVELVDIIGETDWKISEGMNEIIAFKQMIAKMVKLGSLI